MAGDPPAGPQPTNIASRRWPRRHHVIERSIHTRSGRRGPPLLFRSFGSPRQSLCTLTPSDPDSAISFAGASRLFQQAAKPSVRHSLGGNFADLRSDPPRLAVFQKARRVAAGVFRPSPPPSLLRLCFALLPCLPLLLQFWAHVFDERAAEFLVRFRRLEKLLRVCFQIRYQIKHIVWHGLHGM